MADASHENAVHALRPLEAASAIDHQSVAFIDRLFVGRSLGRL
jgi:hypothetical protein